MLLAAVWSPASAQITAICPQRYWFNVDYPFGMSISGVPRVFRFIYTWGTVYTNIFPGWGRYQFANIPSTDGRATLIGPWIEASCMLAWVPLPPYASPQRVLFITELDHGGQVTLNFTPPGDDDGDCDDSSDDGDDSGDDSGDDDSDVGGEYLKAHAKANATAPVVAARAGPSQARSILAAADSVGAANDRTGFRKGGSIAKACTGGNDDGGSTWYCLYLDWYDLEGNYLYSEVIECWEEQ